MAAIERRRAKRPLIFNAITLNMTIKAVAAEIEAAAIFMRFSCFAL